jgi:hypothetical protein
MKISEYSLLSLDVKKAISRCVEVFEQRNVYPPHIIEEMKSALGNHNHNKETWEINNSRRL